MSSRKLAVVVVCESHSTASAAVRALRQSGFAKEALSISGRNHHEYKYFTGYYNASDRVRDGWRRGVAGGLAAGFLAGAAVFLNLVMPTRLVWDTFSGWLAGTLAGAALGGALGALGAALYSLGIPRDSVASYDTAMRAGQFAVCAHLTDEEAARARAIVGGFPSEDAPPDSTPGFAEDAVRPTL